MYSSIRYLQLHIFPDLLGDIFYAQEALRAISDVSPMKRAVDLLRFLGVERSTNGVMVSGC